MKYLILEQTHKSLCNLFRYGRFSVKEIYQMLKRNTKKEIAICSNIEQIVREVDHSEQLQYVVIFDLKTFINVYRNNIKARFNSKINNVVVVTPDRILEEYSRGCYYMFNHPVKFCPESKIGQRLIG